MRVISGTARGKKLEAPEGLTTRPTTDRIKETLFNMIAFDLPDCRFLDLFSGSGAIGIEALSRGATKADFVENDYNACNYIEANLKNTNLLSKSKIYKKDVSETLTNLGRDNLKYDIIFMDPPYQKVCIEEILELILKLELLEEEGYIIVEESSKTPINNIEGYNIIKQKKFRTTFMTFYELQR